MNQVYLKILYYELFEIERRIKEVQQQGAVPVPEPMVKLANTTYLLELELLTQVQTIINYSITKYLELHV